MRGLIAFMSVDQRAQCRLGLRRQRRASRPPLGGGVAALLRRDERRLRLQAGFGQRQHADGPKREPLGAAVVARDPVADTVGRAAGRAHPDRTARTYRRRSRSLLHLPGPAAPPDGRR